MPTESTIAAGTSTGNLARARSIACPLRPARAQAWMLSLPMVTEFRSAYGRSASRKRLIVVRLEDDDGVEGWGEAPIAERPVYCSDTAESTWSAIIDLLIPPIIGRQFSGPAELAGSWADLIGQNYAKNAVESAAWAMTSAKLDTPLAAALGRHP